MPKIKHEELLAKNLKKFGLEEKKPIETKVEAEQRQTKESAAGNAFIREREQRATQLIDLGLSPRGAQRQAAKELSAKNPTEIARKQLEQQQITENVFNPPSSATQADISQLGKLTPEQQALDISQKGGAVNLATTGIGALTGAAGGAVIGAGIGSVVPIAGTAILGTAGAIVGAVGGAFTKISVEKRQNVKEAFAVYTTSKSNMDWIINQVNSGKMSNSVAINMWDDELANFNAAERNLKKETKNSLNRFLSGGKDELAKLEGFRRRIPFKQGLLAQAMASPNPNAVIFSENTDLEELQ